MKHVFTGDVRDAVAPTGEHMEFDELSCSVAL